MFVHNTKIGVTHLVVEKHGQTLLGEPGFRHATKAEIESWQDRHVPKPEPEPVKQPEPDKQSDGGK